MGFIDVPGDLYGFPMIFPARASLRCWKCSSASSSGADVEREIQQVHIQTKGKPVSRRYCSDV